MADRRDKPEKAHAADEFATLAPGEVPGNTPPPPGAQETIAQTPATEKTGEKTPPADIYATMAREIPAGASAASIPSGGAAATGLPFDRVGEYDILGKIGHGGMGLVLKARQRGLKRVVALKMIKVGQLAEETEIARFLVEARAAAHLKHPNIVAVYDVGEHAGSPFFSMEYVEGQSLHKLISERPLQPQRAAVIIQKLALAVNYAHEAGILHRDLKPQNILLDKYEEPKITDFGLASSAQENSQLTATGTVLGTPSYMPPEQARGRHEEMGNWSDIYSLGATLYEALVGRPPFSAATLGETLQQVMSVDPVSPRTLNPAIPRDIETICLKCLEKSPARRYQTGQELADELQRFLEDRPILASPTSRTEKFVRWCRRNPVIAGAIAAVSAAAVVAIVSLWVGRNQALEGERRATEGERRATEGERKATAALQETEKALQFSMNMVDQLLVKLGKVTLLDQPGMQPLTADIYAQALHSYEQLLPKLEKNQRLSKDIAKVQLQMGFATKKLGKPQEALALLEKAAKSLELLRVDNKTDGELLESLSLAKIQMGTIHYEQKRFAAAAIPFQDALLLRREFAELEPENIEAGQLLANSEMNVGLLQEALGKPKEALEYYQAANARRKALLKKASDNSGLLRDRAKGLTNIGLLLAHQNKLAEAEKNYDEARQAFAELVEHKDHQIDDLHDLGISWMRLGDAAAVRNNPADLQLAVDRYYKALRVLEGLVAANPNVPSYRGTLGKTRLNLAQLYERQNNSREAFAQLTIAFDDLQKLQAKDATYKSDRTRAFFEMLRLKKWNKLRETEIQDFDAWLDFASQENGTAWVERLQKLANSATELPEVQLENSVLESLEPGSPKR